MGDAALDIMSVELFLSPAGVCLAVPRGCGLEQADTLQVNVATRKVRVLRRESELPIDFPPFSEAHCKALAGAGEVAVGEFAVQGVVAAYMVKVVAVG